MPKRLRKNAADLRCPRCRIYRKPQDIVVGGADGAFAETDGSTDICVRCYRQQVEAEIAEDPMLYAMRLTTPKGAADLRNVTDETIRNAIRWGDLAAEPVFGLANGVRPTFYVLRVSNVMAWKRRVRRAPQELLDANKRRRELAAEAKENALPEEPAERHGETN